MFGHPIELNFNNAGTRHNTIVGGFVSILVKIAILWYVVLILVRMFSYGDNKEMTSNALIDMRAGNEGAIYNVKYSEM